MQNNLGLVRSQINEIYSTLELQRNVFNDELITAFKTLLNDVISFDDAKGDLYSITVYHNNNELFRLNIEYNNDGNDVTNIELVCNSSSKQDDESFERLWQIGKFAKYFKTIGKTSLISFFKDNYTNYFLDSNRQYLIETRKELRKELSLIENEIKNKIKADLKTGFIFKQDKNFTIDYNEYIYGFRIDKLNKVNSKITCFGADGSEWGKTINTDLLERRLVNACLSS